MSHAGFELAGRAQPLSETEALSLAEADASALPELLSAAASVRDEAFCGTAPALRGGASSGRTVTFSPKVFLPLTNICRNRCDYCSFRRSPGDEGAWTMQPGEVDTALDRARAQSCVEALFC